MDVHQSTQHHRSRDLHVKHLETEIDKDMISHEYIKGCLIVSSSGLAVDIPFPNNVIKISNFAPFDTLSR